MTESRSAFSGFSIGLRYMVAGAFFFSLMSALVKVAGAGLPTSEIVLARALVTVGLTWIALKARGIPPFRSDERGLLLLRGVLGYIALSCFFYAVIHLPLAEATVLHYTNPMFTALLAVVFLKEGIGLREGALILVSFVGVILVSGPSFLSGGGSGLDPVAIAIGITGALFSSGAYITVRRLGRTEEPLIVVFWFGLVTGAASLPLTIPVFVWPRGVEWWALLGVGLTTQWGQLYLTRGLRAERAGRATAVSYVQILFAGAWGAVVFHQIPTPLGLVGGLLIVSSTLFIGRAGAPASAVSAPSPESRGDPVPG